MLERKLVISRKEMTEIHRRLEKDLSNDRYQHTLDVTYTAAAPAMRCQVSIEGVEPVGLLHDCAKRYDKKELLSIAEKSGIRFSAADMTVPQIWHTIIGPVTAEKRYGVVKSGTLSAVHWHTTGRREMSLFEKIVFTTDYIEPNRDRIDNLTEICYLALQDLDFCVYRITVDTLRYLASKQIRADQKTEEYYQRLKEVKKYGDK